MTTTTRTTDASGRFTLTFYGGQVQGQAVISATAGAVTGVGYVWINAGPPELTVVSQNLETGFREVLERQGSRVRLC
ncbi:MAG: hypothetical protein HGA84_07215, partial [Syntrophobacteraceae bacterium]|nr:hypothetical protein [Syntrophobacteraceae bacterium]